MLVDERKDEISYQISAAEDGYDVSGCDAKIRQIPCKCDEGFGEEA